uniref:PDZ domain-containing protein n=1 Tax=Salarias fasciatus TaxID=181472 RepID=A0A672IW17_SALFA
MEEDKFKMAEEEDTREVLFPDWEGPDKTGLTIEQTSGGEIFVKEVKGESPAGRSGKVYEGDQIVGATVYFENMSSEETADLLKALNKHKVGLKLQNRGDKSPGYSPLSTPCRSPIGTLTWEGKTRFGGSSPDIILVRAFIRTTLFCDMVSKISYGSPSGKVGGDEG